MVTTFRLATDEQWKDKSGERTQRTEWHRVVAFRKLAEICGSYLAKGRLVYVEGRLQTRSWEDKEGQKRFTTEIVASNMQILDRGPSRDTGTDDRAPGPAEMEQTSDDDVPF